jgi:hypothetical protein
MTRLNSAFSATATLFLTLALPASAAWAEDTQPPPPMATSGGGSGGGAGIGVGAAAFLAGLTGVEAVYDQSRYHIEGILGFNSNRGMGNQPTVTSFQFGVRGWYHLHAGSRSDFSAGGGIGLLTASGGNNPPTATLVEPGIQARVFLTPNFALHVTAGLTLRFGDNVPGATASGFGLSEQFLGGFGFTYFFI